MLLCYNEFVFMKIGVVGSIWINTPPESYGGTETVIYNLVNGLVEAGHEVTLFGPKTAKVKAKVFPTVERPLREDNVQWENVSYTLYHLAESFDQAQNFDIVHFHLNKSQDYLALPIAQYSKIPAVFTLHFKVPTPTYNKDRYLVLNKYRNLPFISISNSQRDSLNLNYVATVYNGININDYPFSANPDNYFVWLGKVNPVKGTKEAILAAKKAGVKLLVMGAVDNGAPQMLKYYHEEVKPLIDNKNIIWIGEVRTKKKAKILGGAKAFLNPILWEEPFGLVMTESQAVGTPVISFNRGAAPELIVEGKTGFLVKTVDEMVEKIKFIDNLDRKDCRRNIEERFTVGKMIEGYEKAYEYTIKNWSSFFQNYKG